MKLKTKSKELENVLNDLNDIFNNSRKLSKKDYIKLEKLGYKVCQENSHPKMYINYKSKVYVITLSASPSDKNWGRQVLRIIRRIYEQNWKRGFWIFQSQQ